MQRCVRLYDLRNDHCERGEDQRDEDQKNAEHGGNAGETIADTRVYDSKIITRTPVHIAPAACLLRAVAVLFVLDAIAVERAQLAPPEPQRSREQKGRRQECCDPYAAPADAA